jgi:hypothetical protein
MSSRALSQRKQFSWAEAMTSSNMTEHPNARVKMMAERKADQERNEADRKAYEQMMAERKADQERRDA